MNNSFNENSKPPRGKLIEAVRNAEDDKVRSLLKRGADVNEVDKDDSNNTPLLIAATFGHVEIAKILVQAKANLEARDESGSTALIQAAQSNQSEITELLLDAGAKVNAKNNDGDTALHLACRFGYIDDVRALITAGADLHAKNLADQTPAAVAEESEQSEVIEMMETLAETLQKMAAERARAQAAALERQRHADTVEKQQRLRELAQQTRPRLGGWKPAKPEPGKRSSP